MRIVHILLVLLSLLGKILGILLLVLLILLLALLFVPIRYRVRGKKEGEEKPTGFFVVTWLLHLATISGQYDADGFGLTLRLASFPVKRLGSDQKRNESAASGTRKTDGRAPHEKNAATKEQPQGEAEQPVTHQEQSGQKEDAVWEKSGGQEKTEAGEAAEKEKKKAGTGPLKELLERGIRLLHRAMDFLSSLPEKGLETEWKTEERLDRIRKKVEPLLTLSGRHIVHVLLEEIKKLLSYYLPRMAQGYLHFGTGRPDLTGLATGALSLALPYHKGSRRGLFLKHRGKPVSTFRNTRGAAMNDLSAGEYDVQPEFFQTVFETDTLLSGHIRACHLAASLIRLLLDGEIRRMLLQRISRKRKGASHG